MEITKIVSRLSLIAALAACAAYGQSVISAKAGVVHYTEGDVTIASGTERSPVEMKTGGRYTDLKDGQELSTGEGRVEVLLNPGVFLRMGENSAVKMISTRLSDTRLELTRGIALVEVAEVSKDNAVTMIVKDAAVTFSKMALVRMDVDSGIRIYKGEAQVMAGGTPQILKEGREMQFGTGFTVAKFDARVGDPLYRWANRRAEYLAMANIASANMVRQNSTGFSYLNTGGWFYNPFFGMYTYLPVGNGMYRSPFGYMYYSPGRVSRYYQSFQQAVAPSINSGFAGGQNNRTWNSDNGYYTTSSRSAGAVSMPAPSAGAPAASAPAAPAGRGADVGTARGGGSGSSGK
ncbi:MAG: FecR domain-containing protein [Bryobacterales bacterium]|nr:FecR domain-containing protein [Bryobacterales bacterium]